MKLLIDISQHHINSHTSPMRLNVYEFLLQLRAIAIPCFEQNQPQILHHENMYAQYPKPILCYDSTLKTKKTKKNLPSPMSFFHYNNKKII